MSGGSERVNHWIIEASLSWDETGHEPLPSHVGPFFSRPAAQRWIDSLMEGDVPPSGSFQIVPVVASYDVPIPKRRAA